MKSSSLFFKRGYRSLDKQQGQQFQQNQICPWSDIPQQYSLIGKIQSNTRKNQKKYHQNHSRYHIKKKYSRDIDIHSIKQQNQLQSIQKKYSDRNILIENKNYLIIKDIIQLSNYKNIEKKLQSILLKERKKSVHTQQKKKKNHQCVFFPAITVTQCNQLIAKGNGLFNQPPSQQQILQKRRTRWKIFNEFGRHNRNNNVIKINSMSNRGKQTQFGKHCQSVLTKRYIQDINNPLFGKFQIKAKKIIHQY